MNSGDSGRRALHFVLGLAVALLILVPALAQPKSEGSARVEGAVRGVVGVPVTVRLLPVGGSPVRYYDGYQVVAQQNGKFDFTNIKPGAYRLAAKADGFMLATPGKGADIIITLRAHQKLRRVTIRMVPRPSLCGRVRGRFRHTWVDAFRYSKKFGTLIDTFLPATNADGSFCFANLPFGTYYLQAYTTWYPGSFSFSGAKPLVVKPGRTQRTLDIPLQPSDCWTSKVSGRIAPSPTNDHQEYYVDFLQTNANGGSVFDPEPTIRLAPGDRFTASLCPGDYDVVLSDRDRISAWRGHPSHKVVFDSQHVTVGQRDITGVALTPHSMASITGEVHFEDITRAASCPGIGGQHVSILREGDGQYQTAPLDDKDHFEFHNVAPGIYRIYLAPFLREAVYVKSILVDGKAAEGRRFAITRAKPVRIDITLSGDLAEAAGHISPDLRRVHRWAVAWTRPKGSVSGKVEGDTVGVSIELRSARYNSQNSAEYTTDLGPKGSFRFNDVDPGVYTLRAEGKDSFEYEYGAKGLDKKGTPIVVARGAHIKGVRLKLPKLSSICGEVTDANGSPKAGTPVYIETSYYGYLQARQETGEARTDAEGRFRVNGLLPGDYYLAFPFGHRLVFFSSDGSLDAARPVRLHINEDVGCRPQAILRLRVPPGIKETYTISGQVVGELASKLGDRFWVSLWWDVPHTEAYVASANLDKENRFFFDKVPNGRFMLQLHSGYGPKPMVWSGQYGPLSHLLATRTVEVRGRDVVGVKVKSMELPTITGSVRFLHVPADWKHFDVSAYHIRLLRRNNQQPLSARLSANGSFSIGPEDIGNYEVNLYPPPRVPLYIRSVRLNGQEIQGRYFHLSAQATALLEVEVDDDSGRVDATLLPDPSMPRPEPPVGEPCGGLSLVKNRLLLALPEPQIVLFPEPLFPTRTTPASSVEPRLFFSYRVSDGHRTWLQISRVPPGRYRVLGAEHLTSFIVGRTRDLTVDERRLWSALAALGQPLTVRPGAKLQIALQDKSAEVARLAARFGVRIGSGVLKVREGSM